MLVEAGPGQPRLWFQLVPEAKVVENRVHLDLSADDVDAELARLVELGATIAPEQASLGLVVLRDPEGNELASCATDGGRSATLDRQRHHVSLSVQSWRRPVT